VSALNAASESPARPGRLAWGVLAAAVALFAAHAWLYRRFVVDDTYITFRFVQQWWAGNGLVYNIGERVEGYSNFLWIVLLAALNGLGLELLLAAKAAGFVLSATTVLLLARLSMLSGRLPWAALLLAASAPFAAWSVGGLETPLVTFLVLASAYAYIQESRSGRGVLSGLWFALLALARPDGLLYAGVAGLLHIGDLIAARRLPTRQDGLRLLLFFAIVIPYHVWRIGYYGHLLPNTVYAKSMGGHLRGYIEGAYYLYTSLTVAGGVALILLAVGLASLTARRDVAVRYALAATAAQALFLVVAGGDWMPVNRFAVHILPLLYLLVEAGWVRFAAFLPAWRTQVVAAVIVVQAVVFLVQSAELHWIDGVARTQYIIPAQPLTVPPGMTVPDAVVAVIDAGYLVTLLPLTVRVVDMVGLVDAHIAHLPPQFPGGLLGRGDAFGKWDPDYVLAQRPDYIQINVVGRDETGALLTNFTGTTLLARHPEFLRHYRPVEEFDYTNLFARVD
jgi:arabinofuranosyltransferase